MFGPSTSHGRERLISAILCSQAWSGARLSQPRSGASSSLRPHRPFLRPGRRWPLRNNPWRRPDLRLFVFFILGSVDFRHIGRARRNLDDDGLFRRPAGRPAHRIRHGLSRRAAGRPSSKSGGFCHHLHPWLPSTRRRQAQRRSLLGPACSSCLHACAWSSIASSGLGWWPNMRPSLVITCCCSSRSHHAGSSARRMFSIMARLRSRRTSPGRRCTRSLMHLRRVDGGSKPCPTVYPFGRRHSRRLAIPGARRDQRPAF